LNNKVITKRSALEVTVSLTFDLMTTSTYKGVINWSCLRNLNVNRSLVCIRKTTHGRTDGHVQCKIPPVMRMRRDITTVWSYYSCSSMCSELVNGSRWHCYPPSEKKWHCRC